jgi:hypothetical protein
VVGGEHIDGFPQRKLNPLSPNGNQLGSQLFELPQTSQGLGQLIQVTRRACKVGWVEGPNGF